MDMNKVRTIVYKNEVFPMEDGENAQDFLESLDLDLSRYELDFEEDGTKLFISSVSGTKGSDEGDGYSFEQVTIQLPEIFKENDALLERLRNVKQGEVVKKSYKIILGKLIYNSPILTPFAVYELDRRGIVITDKTSRSDSVLAGNWLREELLKELGVVEENKVELSESLGKKDTKSTKAQKVEKKKSVPSQPQPVQPAQPTTPAQATSNDIPKYISIREYAELKGVHRDTPGKWYKQGKIEGYKDNDGRVWLLNPNYQG